MNQSGAARLEDGEGAQSSGTRRPELRVRVGNVEIAGWRNHGSNGDHITTSAPTLRYKDGEEWKTRRL